MKCRLAYVRSKQLELRYDRLQLTHKPSLRGCPGSLGGRTRAVQYQQILAAPAAAVPVSSQGCALTAWLLRQSKSCCTSAQC